jgi:hypothetical protein
LTDDAAQPHPVGSNASRPNKGGAHQRDGDRLQLSVQVNGLPQAFEAVRKVDQRGTSDQIVAHAAVGDSERKLVESLLEEVAANRDGHVAVAVAGWKPEWEQVAKLCDLARANRRCEGILHRLGDRWSLVATATSFCVGWSRVSSRKSPMTPRLGTDLGPAHTAAHHRLQSAEPDESGWTAVANLLDGIATGTTDGVGLRDRLAVKAGHYDGLGAVVDLNLLRGDIHPLLEPKPPAPSRRGGSWISIEPWRPASSAAPSAPATRRCSRFRSPNGVKKGKRNTGPNPPSPSGLAMLSRSATSVLWRSRRAIPPFLAH